LTVTNIAQRRTREVGTGGPVSIHNLGHSKLATGGSFKHGLYALITGVGVTRERRGDGRLVDDNY